VSRYQFRHNRKFNGSSHSARRKPPRIHEPSLKAYQLQIQNVEHLQSKDNFQGQRAENKTYPARALVCHDRLHGDAVATVNEASAPISLSHKYPLESLRSSNSSSQGRENGLWPLSDKDEAYLMRYFITELSLWVRTEEQLPSSMKCSVVLSHAHC
jgi:hypothetical protein